MEAEGGETVAAGESVEQESGKVPPGNYHYHYHDHDHYHYHDHDHDYPVDYPDDYHDHDDGHRAYDNDYDVKEGGKDQD